MIILQYQENVTFYNRMIIRCWTDLLFASEPLVVESRGTSGSAGQYHPAPRCGLLGLWLHCDLDQLCHYHTHTPETNIYKQRQEETEHRYINLDVESQRTAPCSLIRH